MNRRNFLLALGGAALAPPLVWSVLKLRRKKSPETILALLNSGPKPHSELLAYNRAANDWHTFDLPNLKQGTYGAHSIEVSAADPSLLAIISFQAPEAAIFSLQKGRVIAELVATPGRKFAGHGVFTRDGKYLLTTEVSHQNDDIIAMRDPHSGRVLDQVKLGIHPHQIIYPEAGSDVLAITHHGIGVHTEKKQKFKSDVTYYDLDNRKVLQRVSSGVLNDEHCHVVADTRSGGEIFISAINQVKKKGVSGKLAQNDMQYFPATLYAGSRSSPNAIPFEHLGKMDKMTFNFSITMSEKHNTIAMIHRDSWNVSFWDARTKKLLDFRSVGGSQLSGVNCISGGNEFVMNADIDIGKCKLLFVDAKTLTVNQELVVPLERNITSHMSVTSWVG